MRLLTLLLLIPGLFLTACQAPQAMHLYDGPEKPESELSRIELPESLVLNEVNGIEYNNISNYIGGDKTVFLLPGKQVLKITFEKVWNIDEEEHHVFRSKAAEMLMQLQPGFTYKISHPEFTSFEQIEAFSKNVKLDITTVSAGSTVVRSGKRDFTTSPVTVSASYKVQPGNNEPSISTTASKESDTLKLLKEVWTEATQQEKSEFKHWMIDNP